jgi:hypothetical protein
LDKSHKLDACLLDEGPRPKGGKLRPNLHGTILEGISIGSISIFFKRRSKGELMI